MKPRKTRIKVSTKVDGKVVHMPQHKGLFFWYDFNDSDAWSSFNHTNAYAVWCLDVDDRASLPSRIPRQAKSISYVRITLTTFTLSI